MELAGKRFHSRSEKAAYATHTIGPETPPHPLVRQAVWRTDGLAREQVFAKMRTVNWPRQTRIMRTSGLPFAMINGPQDPFIDHDYCAAFAYGHIWRGTPQNIAGAGHAPFLSRPALFNAHFADFLAWAKDAEKEAT